MDWDLPMEAMLSPDQAQELDRLQTELVLLQNRVKERGERVVVLFEGRDTAGKGGAILRFMRYLDPRSARVVALPKPSDRERSQWYFQRYVPHLPAAGELVFFDRSWYNRAIVEPVLGFCTAEQHERFMGQVPLFERMLLEDGIHLLKLWFSIDRETQRRRLEARRQDVRRMWKLSPVDGQAQERWDDVTRYKQAMFEQTSTEACPWHVVRGRDKYQARIEAMRTLLHRMGHEVEGLRIEPDPSVARVWHGGMA